MAFLGRKKSSALCLVVKLAQLNYKQEPMDVKKQSVLVNQALFL